MATSVAPKTAAVVVAAVVTGIGLRPGDALAAGPITLACAINETVTGTNGRVAHRQLRQFVRIDSGVYQIWEGPVSGWGANLCSVSACSLSEGVFQLDSRYASDEDGYRLGHQEWRSIDLRSGRANSQTTDSTTTRMTGYMDETTTYDEGSCAPSPDPETPGHGG